MMVQREVPYSYKDEYEARVPTILDMLKLEDFENNYFKGFWLKPKRFVVRLTDTAPDTFFQICYVEEADAWYTFDRGYFPKEQLLQHWEGETIIDVLLEDVRTVALDGPAELARQKLDLNNKLEALQSKWS